MKRITLLLTLLLLFTGCEKEEFTITYVTNTDQQLDQEIVEGNSVLSTPDELVKEGYVFDGWYKDTDYSTRYDFSTQVSSDMTLYAKWDIKEFDVNYNVDNSEEFSIVIEYQYGDIISLENPQMDGYTFYGWYTTSEMVTLYTSIIATESITLYGTFVENEPEPLIDIALIVLPTGYEDDGIMELTHEGITTFSDDHNKLYKYYKPISSELSDLFNVSDLAISEGADVIILPGYKFENVAFYIQENYPNVKVILLDGIPNNMVEFMNSQSNDSGDIIFLTGENTLPVHVKEQDLGFLAGYLAVKEGYTNLGYIGGFNIPTIRRYGVGYIAGAYYAADELDIDITFNDGTYIYEPTFLETDILEAKAAFMYSIGVEVIFSTTMNGTRSVVKSANIAGKKVIHAEYDYIYAPQSLITTVMKGYDLLVYDLLSDFYQGSLQFGETISYGINDDVVYLSETNSNFISFDQESYDALILNIKNGTIIIPSDYDELSTFLGEDISNFQRDTIEPN